MSDLQFETAEYAGEGPACTVCKQTITGSWWMVGSNPICGGCREGIAAYLAHRASPMDLARGAAFGLGAAVAGSTVWWLVREGTGYELGLLAIGVAWVVSWAIVQGGGRGLPQQLLSVALTYLSIAGSYVPTFYSGLVEDGMEPLGALIGAVGGSIALPVLLGMQGDILWFLIVGFALWSAFRQPARPHLELTGPFQAGPAAG
jgi:hypothetical protein